MQICSLVAAERLTGKVAAEAKPERQQQNIAREYVFSPACHTHPFRKQCDVSETVKIERHGVSASCSVNKPRIGGITERLSYRHALMESHTYTLHKTSA